MINAEIVKSCLNLCDIPVGIMSTITTSPGMEILIGSYTCGNYFEYLLSNLSVVRPSFGDDVYISLVIPVLADNQIQKLISFINENDISFIKKLVVNDFGGIKIYSQFSDKLKIGLGRIWLRQYRDLRYKDYYSKKNEIKLDLLISLLEEFVDKIDSIEIECIGEDISINNIPSEYKVYVHYPNVLLTYGHICEYASVGKEISQKFRADSPCNTDCFQYQIEYESNGLYYYKCGRAVYYTVLPEKNIHISGGKIHLIESKVDFEYENNGSVEGI